MEAKPVKSVLTNPGESLSPLTAHSKPTASMKFTESLCVALAVAILVVSLPFSIWFCIKIVREYQRAVIFRLGRLRPGGTRGPGLIFILPGVDTFTIVDLRTLTFNVPPQEVLSKDSVTSTVDAVVFYSVANPLYAVINVNNYRISTESLAATTLRTMFGVRSLAEILSEREAIAHTMQLILDEATGPWGVKVERVEIKDVRLPEQLQRAMAAEAEAGREARANVITAEGELKASRALKEASDVIDQSPSALQLRYLQTLSLISSEKSSIVMFPFPLDIILPYLNIKK